MVIKFTDKDLREGRSFEKVENKYSAGQVLIIGGSRLFHGAPILALKGASRLVSMTFFASPEEDKEVVNLIKTRLGSFVWIPREEMRSYINKADAVLIGPGMMRSHESKNDFVCDDEGLKTREQTLEVLRQYSNKKWIVDGGSLQVLRINEFPCGAVITPNKKEFEMLFGESLENNWDRRALQVEKLAQDYRLVILTKDEVSIASDGEKTYLIEGGNDGLVKGGVGDVIAGVALGFMAKSEGLWSIAAASFLVKKAAEKLARERDLMFNADDLVEIVPLIYKELVDL